MKKAVGAASTRAGEELVERGERNPDLQSDAAVTKLGGLHERVHRRAADLEPGCHFGGAEPVLDAPCRALTYP